MTLILNELKVFKNLEDSAWIVGADRRITMKVPGEATKYFDTRQKLFAIPYLGATVSYFGLAAYKADLKTDGRGVVLLDEKKMPVVEKWYYMDDLIKTFINDNSEIKSLSAFAHALRDFVNSKVDHDMLGCMESGFHLSGFNDAKLPEFYYFSNISSLDPQTLIYSGFLHEYGGVSEDFLKRDAIELGFDGKDPKTVRETGWIYRNGDIQLQVVLWKSFDQMFGIWLKNFPNFKIPDIRAPFEEYGEYVRFKFEVISYIYKKWSRRKNIGTPIDVFIITAGKVTECPK